MLVPILNRRFARALRIVAVILGALAQVIGTLVG